MKKLIILAFVAASALGVSSCAKARTCSCADGTSYPMSSAKLSTQRTACNNVAAIQGTTCSVK